MSKRPAPVSYISRAGDLTAGAIREFLQLQAAGGILLMLATVVALALANTRAEGLYQGVLETPVEIRIGALALAKPLVVWINDGLMAVFFFLVGLEIKREVMEGELANPAHRSWSRCRSGSSPASLSASRPACS